MGFAKDYLWAKLGLLPNNYWRKVLRTGGGGGVVTEGEFGVEWDYSSPSPKLTRTGDAKRFRDPIPATSLTGTGRSPFDNILPWAGMRMCNIINGEVVYWHGDPQFSETDYDTMVYIPEFWYRAEKDTAASKWRWSISPTEREGYARHPGSGRYISRFHISGGSSGVFAKADVSPLVNISRANFRSYSHNKGAKWWMLDIATWSALLMLYLVEYATFDSQEKLGTGQDSKSILETGRTSGAVYHTIMRSKDSNQYRWVENPASNVRDWLDGFLSSGSSPSKQRVYVGTDPATYSDNPSSLVDCGFLLPSKTGYISDLAGNAECIFAFIPVASDGSLSTFVTDQYYVTDYSGAHAVVVGGDYRVTKTFGLFYFNAYYTPTGTLTNTGARLIFIP